MDKAVNPLLSQSDSASSELRLSATAPFADSKVPCVLLCTGKSCRKAKGFDELRQSFDALATVKTVKCVDVCDGPVVGVRVEGKTVWFERLRSKKVRAAVVSLLRPPDQQTTKQTKIPKQLRQHRA